jgi:hypothetical protein
MVKREIPFFRKYLVYKSYCGSIHAMVKREIPFFRKTKMFGNKIYSRLLPRTSD